MTPDEKEKMLKEDIKSYLLCLKEERKSRKNLYIEYRNCQMALEEQRKEELEFLKNIYRCYNGNIITHSIEEIFNIIKKRINQMERGVKE